MVGGFLFSIALIPAIHQEQKPPITTSLLTATVLTVFSMAMSSLDLWWGTIGTALAAVCWWILLLQRIAAKQ